MVFEMGEGTVDAAFGFGLAECGWVYLWIFRWDELLRQESAILSHCTAFE